MKQMQSEMLSRARFDGGYPKPVLMLGGILALAKNEEEYKKLIRQTEIELNILAVLLIIFTIFIICFIGFLLYKSLNM